MSERVARVALLLLVVSAVIVGVWAEFFPRNWYDEFPGLGQNWVSVDGPYNEHLVRDVGGLNLALAVVTGAAFLKGTRLLGRTAAIAWLVYSVPHLVYHATGPDVLSGADQTASLSALGWNVFLAAVVLLALRPGVGAEPSR